MSRKRVACAAGAALIAACASAEAAAPPVNKTTDAALRGSYDDTGMRGDLGPEYDSIGLRMGDFIAYPEVKLEGDYTDNLYATRTNRISDWIGIVQPALHVMSDWGRHALNFTAQLAHSFHALTTTEDTTDWLVGTDGRLDITRDTQIKAEANYAQQTEPRGVDTSILNAKTPTRYDNANGDVTLLQEFNRLTFSLKGAVQKLTYDTVELFGGGTASNKDRDRTVYDATLRTGYDVSPQTNIFVQGGYNTVLYELKPPTVPEDLSSHGYEVDLGADLRTGSPLHGTVLVGYQRQTYKAALPDLSGLTYNVNIDWDFTRLSTLHLYGGSTIQESIYNGSFGTIERTAGIGLTHFLFRDLRLTGDARYIQDNFEETTRRDSGWNFTFGMTWLTDRNWEFGLGYQYQTRSSTQAQFDFRKQLVSANITAQF
jgi:hypothetical protein